MKRRDFIKLSALAASSAGASRIQGIQETIFDSKTALGANRFGAFVANLNSSQITSTQPFEGDAFSTTMNNALPSAVQNEARVMYPYVRKSYLKAGGPAKPTKRGDDEFVRVSWDVALDLAAKALKENYDKYGSESIYGECYWWGGSGKVSWGRTVAHRMLSLLGGYVEESGDYSTGAGLVIMPHVLGSSAVYDAPTKWEAVLDNCEHAVFWGTDPVVTNQISSVVPLHENYKYFTELKEYAKAGKIKLTSIDTYCNNTARYLQTDYIPVVPNTDTALMLGLCHYLYTQGLYDEDFVRHYTVGFNKFKPYLLGETDGVAKSVEWASEICGVEASKLKELATSLRQKRSLLIIGRALQRQDHGEQSFWAAVTLAAMLGHIGKRGCGFEFSLGYGCSGAKSYLVPNLSGISAIAPGAEPKMVTIPSSRSVEALLNPGKVINQNGKEIRLPRMRVAYNASGSMFSRHQQTNLLLKAWAKFDTIITAEPYWTATAKLSDIVLPVAIEPERTDIIGSSGAYIFAMKPIIEPMGESKSDFEICFEICKRWGMGERFSEGKNELEWVRQIYAGACEQAKDMGYKNVPSFDEFYQKGYAKFDKVDESKRYYTRLEAFRQNPRKNRLGTPSGKIEIYSPVIHKMGYADCAGHPKWYEPFEWLGQKERKYPLAISSPHSRFRLHSQLNNSVLREYSEINAREPMLISPADAQKRGIKTGDVVRVFNDRGEILCGALVTPTAQDGVIIICEGAWYDPQKWGKPSLCKHGCVNVLTKDKGTSSLAQSNTAHTTLAQVELYKGKIEPITAFSKPTIVQEI